jgi:hypothetical protein
MRSGKTNVDTDVILWGDCHYKAVIFEAWLAGASVPPMGIGDRGSLARNQLLGQGAAASML